MICPHAFSVRAMTAVLAISLASLATAWIAQYGFGLEPCYLCLWQRVPFAANAVLMVLALAFIRSESVRGKILLLAGLFFIANSGIALYHLGVEQAWWAGSAACTAQAPLVADVADLLKAMEAPPAARCDRANWTMFGVSMAGYNIPYSLGLGLGTLFAAIRVSKAVKP